MSEYPKKCPICETGTIRGYMAECSKCDWLDDSCQEMEPDDTEGHNAPISFNEAKKLYKQYGNEWLQD